MFDPQVDAPFLAAYKGEHGEVYVALDLGAFSCVTSWGLVIADLVQHVAKAAAENGSDEQLVRTMLIQTVTNEMTSPTDKAEVVEWT